MQLNNSNNNIVIRFLISPRLKIIRHLALWIVVLSIFIGLAWYEGEQALPMSSFDKFRSLFLYVFIFMVFIYFNIYVLTPRLLLKNRWGLYFCSLSGIVVFILFVFILITYIFYEDFSEQHHPEGIIHILAGVINLISNFMIFYLLFAGTSTFVLFKRWAQDMKLSEELRTATLQMELKLLENQINPHFLFNILNNANIKIEKDPYIAIHIIEKLEEMLGYLMNEGTHEKVSLQQEISFLSDYLELEKTRRDQFRYTVVKNGDRANISIAPLLFISFVENAVKHNQDSRLPSYVNVSFNIIENTLLFICVNSIPQHTVRKKEVGGIGLTNIKRRLELLYNGNHSLEQKITDLTYTVKLELKL